MKKQENGPLIDQNEYFCRNSGQISATKRPQSDIYINCGHLANHRPIKNMDAIKLLTYFFKQLSHLNLLSGIRALLLKKQL